MGGEQQPAQRQFVKFTFFKIDAAWRHLSPETRAEARRELCETVDSFAGKMLVRSYSLAGLRGDADFLIWLISEDLRDFPAFSTAVFSTAMGAYLSTPYSYLSMTRRSIYKTPTDSREVDGRTRVLPGGAAYLFVYPFVKTRAWYELPKDVRQEMMDQHIGIGKKYPSVKLNTTYSYGIDDQEFVVSFETDSPSDFLDLVMELRETKASMYTLRDTPTFTCVSMPLPDVLLSLGAPGDTKAPAAPGPAASSAWAPVARVADLPEGSSRVVHVAGEQVALFNAGGRIYAIDNRCSHANGPLSEGRLEGATVTCPYHDSQFDLATGKPLRSPAQRAVATYEVKIDDGNILLAWTAATSA
jgi:chlorite dismutase/nitrite reductase/ring-hydroxylating ferredoxin subunit